MHPACNIKRFLSVLLVLFMFLSSGCQKEKNSVKLGDWIHELCSQAGISDYSQSDPYFMNIPVQSKYFKDVQAAVEWDVLNPDYGFDPDQKLTRSWVAGTLMNLAGKKQDTDMGIRDISSDPFQEQIQAAVAGGLMKTDQRKMFHPDDLVEKEEANKLLEKTIAFINSRKIDDTVNDIEWNGDTKVLEITPESVEPDTMTMISDGQTYEEGTILHMKDPATGNDEWYEVMTAEGNIVHLKRPDLMEKTDSINLEGSADIDFSKAEIMDGEGNRTQESVVETSGTSLMAYHVKPYAKSFTIKDFTVSLKATASGVSADVSKKTKAGNIRATAKINGVHCDYVWNEKKKDIRDAYFKVKFSSSESLSLTNGSYKNLYGDFSKVSPDSFLTSIQKIWTEKNDVVEETFTIAKIRVPMPNAPLMNLNMNLDLHINAEGKAQLVLTQNNEAGCEVRNGKIRIIKNSTSKANADIRSSASITAGIRFGIDATSVTLADAGINAGAKALVKTTAHLYDSEGKHQKTSVHVPTDVADELSDGNGNVLICGDVNAYWVLNVKVNSSSSLLGKIGLSKKAELLDQKNASLLPKGKTHIENFHFVNHCTRGEHVTRPSADTIHVTNRIRLDDYSFALDAGKSKQIRITGIPEGYQLNQLTFVSEKPDIASVDAGGIITAHASGSTKITISTSDNLYKIHCSVLVPVVSE